MKTFGDYLIEQVAQTQSANFFQDFLQYKDEVNAEDVTIQFLDRLKEYALERVSANSAHVYLGYFRRAFYKAEREGYTFSIRYEDVVKYLKVRKESSESVYLTATEVAMLESYEPISKVEHFVKNVFLLSCYTGIRAADYPYINESAFYDNELRYVSTKTKSICRLPLHPSVPKIAKEIENCNYANPSVIISQYIKTILKKLGINEVVTLYRRGERVTGQKWKYVGSHTGRKTFATNCYLSGYSTLQISKMLSHSNVQQTEQYIITDYSDDIDGYKTYLNPEQNGRQSKLDAIRHQLVANLGLSEVDAQAMVDGLKMKIA